MRNYYWLLVLMFLISCNGAVTKPPNIENPVLDVSITYDAIQIDIKNEDIVQEVILPVIDECTDNKTCNNYRSGGDMPVCNIGNLYALPENINSICTNLCNIVDGLTENNKCKDLPTATCCTAVADKDSYFSSFAWCVPKDNCCKANEKLCGLNCCLKEWHCGTGGCSPQCEKDSDCNDGNICTNDVCVNGICQNFDISASLERPYGCCFFDHHQCTDGNFCTIDSCKNNWCEHLINPKCECQPDWLGGDFKECDDGDITTEDICDNGKCKNILIPGKCLSDKDCDDNNDAIKITCQNNQCELDCIYDCVEKECGVGSGGCNESCGNCSIGTFCNGWEQCQCDPNYYCKGKECGPDQCGGICGTCPQGYKCNFDKGKCECIPKCAGKECGSDECGGSCGECPIDYKCNISANKCELQNPCKNLECGWIGEGQNTKYCGDCPTDKICGINGKCKTPQLVCSETPYENYICQETCNQENIQSSGRVLSQSGGAYLLPANNRWITVEIPGFWKDADIVKIKFIGAKICLKSVDNIDLKCVTNHDCVTNNAYPMASNICSSGSVVVGNKYCNWNDEIILDTNETKLSCCFSSPSGGYDFSKYAPFGHFPVPQSILQDGKIKLRFEDCCEDFKPFDWICEKCDCLKSKMQCSFYDSWGKFHYTDYPCYCPQLCYVKVVPCHYE